MAVPLRCTAHTIILYYIVHAAACVAGDCRAESPYTHKHSVRTAREHTISCESLCFRAEESETRGLKAVWQRRAAQGSAKSTRPVVGQLIESLCLASSQVWSGASSRSRTKLLVIPGMSMDARPGPWIATLTGRQHGQSFSLFTLTSAAGTRL